MSGKIPLLTETFIGLSNCPASITENHVNILEQYLIKVYFTQMNEYHEINEARVNSNEWVSWHKRRKGEFKWMSIMT